jgi:alpha-L-fucosidase
VDASNPAYAGLYGPPVSREAWDYKAKVELIPNAAFCRLWEDKVKEVIDKYRPDLIYFDSRLGNIAEPYRLDLLAHYYNRAQDWGKEVVLTYKGARTSRPAPAFSTWNEAGWLHCRLSNGSPTTRSAGNPGAT